MIIRFILLALGIHTVVGSATVFAQTDLILLNSGESVEGKVTDIYPSEIVYRSTNSQVENQLSINLVKSITYSNGITEKFTSQVKSSKPINDTYEGRTGVLGDAVSYSLNDILDKEVELVFYGLDFTNTAFVGSRHKTEADRFNGDMLQAMNNQIVWEGRKFNFAKPLKKRSFERDIEMVRANNASVLVTGEGNCPRDMSMTETQLHLNGYNPKAQEGIGLIIFPQCLNYEESEGKFQFVLFDIKTKAVLHSSLLSGRPGGIGWKGYWMNSLHDALGKYKPLTK